MDIGETYDCLTMLQSSDNMLDVKTASIRHVQHHFADVIAHVRGGEDVLVTYRNQPVVRIVPADEDSSVPLPDFMARLERRFPTGAVAESDVLERDRDSWR